MRWPMHIPVIWVATTLTTAGAGELAKGRTWGVLLLVPGVVMLVALGIVFIKWYRRP